MVSSTHHRSFLPSFKSIRLLLPLLLIALIGLLLLAIFALSPDRSQSSEQSYFVWKNLTLMRKLRDTHATQIEAATINGLSQKMTTSDAPSHGPAVAAPLTLNSIHHCSHLTSSSLTSFITQANSLRSASTIWNHSIPRQILWNYGMWSDDATESNLDSTQSLADGITLTIDSPYLPTLHPLIRTRLLCWFALYPPPLWSHHLWNKRASEAFLKKYHPDLVPTYQHYTRAVQRADLLRVALVNQFGGLYLDLDVLPKSEPLDVMYTEAYPHAQVLLFEEVILTPSQSVINGLAHSIRKGKPEECQRIANYMFAARAQHDLMKKVLEEINVRSRLSVMNDYDVLFTTGPALLTTCVYRYFNLASESSVCRLASGEPVRNGVEIVRRPQDQRWFDHIVSGTWRNRQDAK